MCTLFYFYFLLVNWWAKLEANNNLILYTCAEGVSNRPRGLTMGTQGHSEFLTPSAPLVLARSHHNTHFLSPKSRGPSLFFFLFPHMPLTTTSFVPLPQPYSLLSPLTLPHVEHRIAGPHLVTSSLTDRHAIELTSPHLPHAADVPPSFPPREIYLLHSYISDSVSATWTRVHGHNPASQRCHLGGWRLIKNTSLSPHTWRVLLQGILVPPHLTRDTPRLCCEASRHATIYSSWRGATPTTNYANSIAYVRSKSSFMYLISKMM